MNISWLVENHVLLVDCGTHITRPQIKEMNKTLIHYLSESDTKLTILFLTSNLKQYPFTFTSLQQVFTFLTHEQLEITITIAHKPMIRLMYLVLSSMIKNQSAFSASTYDRAIALLKRLKPGLIEDLDGATV